MRDLKIELLSRVYHKFQLTECVTRVGFSDHSIPDLAVNKEEMLLTQFLQSSPTMRQWIRVLCRRAQLKRHSQTDAFLEETTIAVPRRDLHLK